MRGIALGLAFLFALAILSGCAGNAKEGQESGGQTAPQTGQGFENELPPAPPGDVEGSPPLAPPNQPAITDAELSKHRLETDCWVAYRNKVYDITAYLPKHPGSSAAILPYCGTREFEAAFEAKHGKSKVQMLLSQGIFKGELSG
ncbi:MAG: hypothetical protein N3E51_02930 [Candidatus Micrarchaeota archaeon]|nr:hypothetical protein [Candidatus Micrarchaeota archaeon]